MVEQPEDYAYSSHRVYLGMESTGIVDADSVLRHFGAKKDVARVRYRQFVAAAITHGHRQEFYATDEGRILGTEEFINATIHRIGETDRSNHKNKKDPFTGCEVQPERLVASVEKVCRIRREDFCGGRKSAPAILAKEMFILIGVQMGTSGKVLAEIAGISPSSLSRRHDAALLKVRDNVKVSKLASEIVKQYRSGD
jgi:hypothetical protein